MLDRNQSLHNTCELLITPLTALQPNGWGCSSVGRASYRHAADAGSIPRCGKGLFSQSQFSLQTSLMVSVQPGVQSQASTFLRKSVKDRVVHVSSVDYGNTETYSMHHRLGSATLSQLLSSGKAVRIFLGEKFQWDNTV